MSCREGACEDAECFCQSDAECDDGNPCTSTSCDPRAGCIIAPLRNGTVCDDGIACTVASSCKDGMCVGVASDALCDDGNDCTTNICSVASGGCLAVEVADGTSCDDGVGCTDGQCADGACIGTANHANCDDGDVCTINYCDIQEDCQVIFTTAPCDDGNECTTDDVCSQGVCRGVSGDLDYTACDGATETLTPGICIAAQCSGATEVQFTPADPDTCDAAVVWDPVAISAFGGQVYTLANWSCDGSNRHMVVNRLPASPSEELVHIGAQPGVGHGITWEFVFGENSAGAGGAFGVLTFAGISWTGTAWHESLVDFGPLHAVASISTGSIIQEGVPRTTWFAGVNAADNTSRIVRCTRSFVGVTCHNDVNIISSVAGAIPKKAAAVTRSQNWTFYYDGILWPVMSGADATVWHDPHRNHSLAVNSSPTATTIHGAIALNNTDAYLYGDKGQIRRCTKDSGDGNWLCSGSLSPSISALHANDNYIDAIRSPHGLVLLARNQSCIGACVPHFALIRLQSDASPSEDESWQRFEWTSEHATPISLAATTSGIYVLGTPYAQDGLTVWYFD